MTEIEYIKELVNENKELQEEIFRYKAMEAKRLSQLAELRAELKEAQIKEAQYSWTTRKDVYEAKIPVETVCRIFSLDAGICIDALDILNAKETLKDKTDDD